ncbi:MAG: phosphoadenosine phosphosulfate reductase family protein [bacterium]|nr:phosphoadenosine phosphosulfate reductase family protein [bacterium]
MFFLSEYSRKYFGAATLEEILEEIRKHKIERAVAAFSGGMDSAVAVYVCRELCGIEVKEAIFVDHYWIWDALREQVPAVAAQLGLRLYRLDITEQLRKRLLGAPGKNVCRICTRIKYEILAKKARELGYQYIITGHNGTDLLAFALLDYYKKGLVRSLEVAPFPPRYARRYGVVFVRPLIRLAKQDIERLAEAFRVPYIRVYEPGDKPHKVHREGCTLQHIDNEAIITEDILEKVKLLNEQVNKIARQYKIPAAIKYPSLRIEILCSDPVTKKLLEQEIQKVLQESNARSERDNPNIQRTRKHS